MTDRPFKETPYETGWVCEDTFYMTKSTQYADLDGYPPLEIIASVMHSVIGLKAKSDRGTVRLLGSRFYPTV